MSQTTPFQKDLSVALPERLANEKHAFKDLDNKRRTEQGGVKNPVFHYGGPKIPESFMYFKKPRKSLK